MTENETLSPTELGVMSHAIGGRERYRNHYSASPGHDQFETWERLVERGLATMQRNHLDEVSESVIFRVTEEGMRIVGLYERRT